MSGRTIPVGLGTIVVGLALVGGLAACGSSAGTNGASGSTGASGPVGTLPGSGGSSGPIASGTAPGAGNGSGRAIDVCKTLPASTASSIVGTTFTTTKSRSYAGMLSCCEYSGSGDQLLQVEVDTTYGSHLMANDADALKAIGHPPISVTGVGDSAIAEPDPKGQPGAIAAADTVSFAAVFGDTYIKVGGMYVTQDQGKQIVELLHAAT